METESYIRLLAGAIESPVYAIPQMKPPLSHSLTGAFFTATSMIRFMAGAGVVVRNSIILYCRSGVRSGRAASTLAKGGFRTANAGGFGDWKAAGLPVRKPSEPPKP
jgi:rhodanese-related sulfurtransferase